MKVRWPAFTSRQTPRQQALHSDDELMRLVARRDRGAFEVLYRRYYRRIYGYVGRWLDQPESVEEVIDDVLFIVWTDAEKFQARSRVSTWILGIAHHQTMAVLRRSHQHPGLEEAHEPAAENAGIQRWELRRSLSKAMDQLSAEHRAVLELTYYEGCSIREIAEIQGCPENTVKTRMFYARRQMRNLLPRFGWAAAGERG